MTTLAEGILPFLLVGFFLLLVVETVIRKKMLATLRERHRVVWERLGSPSVLWNASAKNGMAFLRFAWGRDVDSLMDAELTTLARTWRVLQMIVGALLLVGGVLVISLLVSA